MAFLGVACSGCIFWKRSLSFADRRTGARLGQCRAHAPIVLEQEGRPITRWPVVAEGDWCGDHSTAEDV